MSTKLYVGNLPYEATESELQALFESAGAVSTVNIVRDRATGQPRGFAFVEMNDATAHVARLPSSTDTNSGEEVSPLARRSQWLREATAVVQGWPSGAPIPLVRVPAHPSFPDLNGDPGIRGQSCSSLVARTARQPQDDALPLMPKDIRELLQHLRSRIVCSG